MAKDKITDYDSTASGNLDVGGISVAEGMLPSGVNNAIRELMSHQADAFGAGTPLYVDQTNNRVGVGNAAPATALDVTGGLNTTGRVGIGGAETTVFNGIGGDMNLVVLGNDSTTTIGNNSNSGIAIVNTNHTAGNIAGLHFARADTDYSPNYAGASIVAQFPEAQVTGQYPKGDLAFLTSTTTNSAPSEKIRLTAAGNLLVGTTGALITGNAKLSVNGQIEAVTSNTPVIDIARTDGSGTLINFRQAGGAVVGSIQVIGGKLTINSQGSNLSYATGGVVRMNNDSAQFYSETDNTMNLGIGSLRWNTLFASNGTINTSDANEKQQIAALTEAEMTAAKAISQLFKTFKWNDSVAEKGDAARTHTGVIAQDVQAAMSAAGLSATNYAFWCSDTWWETQTEVPAVEAVDAVYEDVVIPAVLDDDGNEVEAERTEQRTVTEAVEAVAAYTRTDTYDTAEKAPDGATERNRKGIRYPELLAFVGAATEQRLANIETRLAALEAN